MPAVLVTAGIALLSLWENPQLPPSIAADDKIVHGLMYMCLAVVWLVPIQVHLRKRNASVNSSFLPIARSGLASRHTAF